MDWDVGDGYELVGQVTVIDKNGYPATYAIATTKGDDKVAVLLKKTDISLETTHLGKVEA